MESVNSIFDKEVEVALSDRRLVIKGSGLNASKLNVEEGLFPLRGERNKLRQLLRKFSEAVF